MMAIPVLLRTLYSTAIRISEAINLHNKDIDFKRHVSVSELMGTLKGKLAIKLFKSYPQLKQKPYWVIIFGLEAILSTQLV
jgi:integrase